VRIVIFTLLILVLLFAAVAIVGGMMLDRNYVVERSIVIDATPATIHTIVGDLKRWNDWSPFERHDESVVVTLGGQTTGVGATQSWTSDDGPGALTFIKSDPQTGIEYELAFGADDKRMLSKGVISYEVIEGGTRTTWTMRGRMDQAVVGGYVAAMMDAMVGQNFDKGLKKLKEVAESERPVSEQPVTGKPAPVKGS